ncbi:MAG: DNA-processing protein DprA, partial [Solirubrobacterales bacterium]
MSACAKCLGRAGLLARLAPNIERAACDRRGSSSGDLLSLSGAELAKAVGGGERATSAALPPAARDGEFGSTCRHRPGYPAPLAHLGAAAPHSLWLRGDHRLLELLDQEPAVTIVGSRRATQYGREIAHELGLLL